MAWAEDFSANTIKLIGAAEVHGAIGLVLPAATGILPWLTPLAAVVHVRHGEAQVIVVNAVLGLLAAFVAWQRFGPQSF